MADTADRILHDLRRRRDELKPLVDELERIEAAIDALERAADSPASNGSSPAPAQRPASGTGRRRGRPRKGEPNRTDQFLALVREGSVSIPSAAKALGIGPNYLYRLANTLQAEGTIRKQGREYVMNVESAESDNAEILPEPEESQGQAGSDNDDLVTDEGVNEGTREIVEE